MTLKPADFNLSIRDFLTILVPGVVLTFALTPESSLLFGRQRLFPGLRSEAQAVVAFTVAAFVLGHLIEAIASVLLDRLYDRTYRNYQRLPPLSEPEGRSNRTLGKRLLRIGKGVAQTGRRLFQAWRLNDTDSHDPLRDAARKVHLSRVRQVAKELADAQSPSLLNWTQSAVALRATPGAREIESLQAASKFFRSMSIVVILVPLLALIRTGAEVFKVSHEPIAQLWALLLTGLCLAVLMSFRFMQLRWTATQRTYEYYIESLALTPALHAPVSREGVAA
jgi:hypothetical protein